MIVLGQGALWDGPSPSRKLWRSNENITYLEVKTQEILSTKKL